MRMLLRLVLSASLVVLADAGCGAAEPLSCNCAANFAIIQVSVVDTVGAPVGGLSPNITLVRTGAAITPDQMYAFGAGAYVVVTDHEQSMISTAGDAIHFTVSSAGRSASADFVVGVTSPCRCHIQRVSGPNTLVLR